MGWPSQIFNWLGYGQHATDPVATTNGGVKALLIDAFGRLQVRLAGGPPPTGRLRSILSTADSVACDALIELWGFNNDATNTIYLQIFDLASAPSEGEGVADGLIEVIRVAPGESFSFAPLDPLPLSAGFSWVSSTTADEYTAPDPGDGEVVLTAVYQ